LKNTHHRKKYKLVNDSCQVVTRHTNKDPIRRSPHRGGWNPMRKSLNALKWFGVKERVIVKHRFSRRKTEKKKS